MLIKRENKETKRTVREARRVHSIACIVLSLAVLLAAGFCLSGCSDQPEPAPASSPPPLTPSLFPSTVTPTLPLLLEDDVPELPSLSYADMGGNEWELKRLRISREGFEILDERGRISMDESGHFTLSDTSDSPYLISDREKDNDSLQSMLWSGLESLLTTENNRSIQGILEYYGGYYAAMAEDTEIVMYSLLNENPPYRGGMQFGEFCESAWAFFCYVENATDPVYGGSGLKLPY